MYTFFCFTSDKTKNTKEDSGREEHGLPLQGARGISKEYSELSLPLSLDLSDSAKNLGPAGPSLRVGDFCKETPRPLHVVATAKQTHFPHRPLDFGQVRLVN